MALTKIGATLGGSAYVIQVTQSSHGLSLGFPVKVSGNGTYAHASADSSANAEAIGIIIATTTDTMIIALGGRITIDGVLPSGNLAAGTVLFLPTSAGKLTATEPSGNNEVSKPMAVITYLNSEMIMIQQRGEVISTAGITIADESVDSDHYVDGSIDLVHMSVNSIDSDQYVDGSIDRVHLAADSIDGTKIDDDAINSEHYAPASIDNEHLADNAVDSAEIAADAVTNAKLANMATRTVKANATSGSANPTDVVMADGDFLIANGSALVTVPITGDVVISNAGVATIQTDAVDIAMLSASGTASSSTFLAGNNAWAAAGGKGVIWQQVHAVSGTATLSGEMNDYGMSQIGTTGGGAADGKALFTTRIPSDFALLTKAVIVYVADGTGNMRWSVTTDFGADDEHKQANQDSISTTTEGTTGADLADIDVSAALTDIAANDTVGFNWVRVGTDGADNLVGVYVLGLLLEYTT